MNIMDDIQSKILDKMNVGPLQAVVGLLGEAMEFVVNALTSFGMRFDIYSKAIMKIDKTKNEISPEITGGLSAALGFKFTANAFEAYLEHTEDGTMAFCFAIKSVFDSCGGGLENIIMMLKQVGELVLKVVTEIVDAIDTAFNEVAKFMVNLGEVALKAGEIVIDAIGTAFENGAAQVAKWAEDVGGAVVRFTENVIEQMRGGLRLHGLMLAKADEIGSLSGAGQYRAMQYLEEVETQEEAVVAAGALLLASARDVDPTGGVVVDGGTTIVDTARDVGNAIGDALAGFR